MTKILDAIDKPILILLVTCFIACFFLFSYFWVSGVYKLIVVYPNESNLRLHYNEFEYFYGFYQIANKYNYPWEESLIRLAAGVESLREVANLDKRIESIVKAYDKILAGEGERLKLNFHKLGKERLSYARSKG